MEGEINDIDSIVLYWRTSADLNYSTMQNLMKSKDYPWALFMGHLVVEKLIKALYVKKLQKHPLLSHDLLRLFEKIDILLPFGYDEWLDEITTFNLNARYDDYKQSFHRRCTIKYTGEWINKIEILRQWLINQL